jgi:predicted N-acetyltransferase YhbS
MGDMLVNLLKLPPLEPLLDASRKAGIVVRRAQPWEITKVREFITKEFHAGWADETSVGFARQPVSIFLAIHKQKIVGFAAYECTRRNYFGPEGVAKKMQGKGIGKVLLIASLHSLRDMGYVYCIIGGAGPVDFYSQCVGAVPIASSGAGIYVDPVK